MNIHKELIDELIENCRQGNLNRILQIYNETEYINMNIQNDILFRISCANNYIDIALWLYNLHTTDQTQRRINIHAGTEDSFRWSCEKGHFEIAKWLYRVGIEENTPINIHIFNEYPFRWSCINGHFEIALWLYTISLTEIKRINIFINDHEAFIKSCKNKHLDIALWLCSLCDFYKITVIGDKYIADVSVIHLDLDECLTLPESETKEKYIDKLYEICGICVLNKEDICMICLSIDTERWVKMCCGHIMCLDCYTQYDKCPYRCKSSVFKLSKAIKINFI